MKIGVVGSGAMGSLFGARLMEAGADIVLVDIDRPHIAAMQAEGLTFDDRGACRSGRPSIMPRQALST